MVGSAGMGLHLTLASQLAPAMATTIRACQALAAAHCFFSPTLQPHTRGRNLCVVAQLRCGAAVLPQLRAFLLALVSQVPLCACSGAMLFGVCSRLQPSPRPSGGPMSSAKAFEAHARVDPSQTAPERAPLTLH